jgi:DcuC family C4-dicarboxylate transporter
LFNPGAPELNTVAKPTGTSPSVLAREHLPWVVVPQLAVGTLVFWALSRWWWKSEGPPANAAATPVGRINWLKAAVPLVPLVLLMLSGPPLNLLTIPDPWLAEADPALPSAAAEKAVRKMANGRLVGLAMVIGSIVAAATSPKQASGAAKAFFEGAGYGFANIVSLIIVAVAFGTAVEKAGFKDLIGQWVTAAPWLLVPLAVLLPWAFAVASGSGMASTASLYEFFYRADAPPGANEDVGALVSIGSAAGRTMSPVAAVAVMCGRLTDTTPWALAGRVAVPLLAGLAVVIVLRMCGVV